MRQQRAKKEGRIRAETPQKGGTAALNEKRAKPGRKTTTSSITSERTNRRKKTKHIMINLLTKNPQLKMRGAP